MPFLTPDAYTMEWVVQPEGYVPFEHIHLNQDEVFHLQSGEIRIVIDRQEQIGKAGQTITVPKGVRHIAYNNKPEMLTCIVEYRPGLDHYRFFQCFAGLILDKEMDGKGGVSIPKMMYFVKKMNTQALARPTSVPKSLVGLLLNVFYFIGTLAGKGSSDNTLGSEKRGIGRVIAVQQPLAGDMPPKAAAGG